MSSGKLLLDRVRMHPSGFKNGAIPIPPPKPPPGTTPGQGASHGQGVGKGKGAGQGVGGGKTASLAQAVAALAAISTSSSRGVVSPDVASLIRIGVQTGDGTTGTFTFSSIPGAYQWLELFVVGRSSGVTTLDTCYVQFNADTAANYDWGNIRGNNSAASATQAAADANGIAIGSVVGASGTASYPGLVIARIPGYGATTTFYKVVKSSTHAISSAAAAGINVFETGGTWRNTAAITRIDVKIAGNWVTGSTATLYGYAI